MRDLVLISDTHNLHKNLKIPYCDYLIHAGDLTKLGYQYEVENFLSWFGKQDTARHKILIAGNHDFMAEDEPDSFIQLVKEQDIIYLDHETIELEGLVLFGSAHQFNLPTCAFFKDDPVDSWKDIPVNCDIAITHIPPYGLGDRVRKLHKDETDYHVGCPGLLHKIETINPTLHVYGHIHEGAGEYKSGACDTRFINASMLNHRYEQVHSPIHIQLDEPRRRLCAG